jgi:hypothetical protein
METINMSKSKYNPTRLNPDKGILFNSDARPNFKEITLQDKLNDLMIREKLVHLTRNNLTKAN